MTDVDGARPQDGGRAHRRAGRPSDATLSLLERYQAAMRDELAGVLLELAGVEPPVGLFDTKGAPPPRVRPTLAERAKLWDLGIKIGRELGASIDPAPPPPPAGRKPGGRQTRPDFG